MSLNKQQKIYAAVLGLAVAAFAFDRFVLGPSDSADDLAVKASAQQRGPRRPSRAPARAASVATAASASARPGGTPAGIILPPGAAATASTSGGLAQRLSQIANPPRPGTPLDLEHVPDAFRPSPVLVGVTKPEPVTVIELHDAARDFTDKYRDKLTLVMKNGNGAVVIIDKKRLSIGQQLDGFRLVAVNDRSAVLWRGSQRVELRISAPNIGSAGGDGTAYGATSEKVAGGAGE